AAQAAAPHDDGDPTTTDINTNANTNDEQSLDTIHDMFDALRRCWVAPAPALARAGMQMSVRLSFKRTGELMGPPRLTYVSPEALPEQRDTYRKVIDAALDRCTPMPFTKGLGGAIAGRPVAIRFVDDRTIKVEHQ